MDSPLVLGTAPCGCCASSRFWFSTKVLGDHERVALREVPDREVRDALVELRDFVLPLVCRDLEIPQPVVHWYRQLKGEDFDLLASGWAHWARWHDQASVGGFVLWKHPDAIWISTDLQAGAPAMRESIGRLAHECKHLWQYRNYPNEAKDPAYREAAEQQAWEYGSQWIERLLPDAAAT